MRKWIFLPQTHICMRRGHDIWIIQSFALAQFVQFVSISVEHWFIIQNEVKFCMFKYHSISIQNSISWEQFVTTWNLKMCFFSPPTNVSAEFLPHFIEQKVRSRIVAWSFHFYLERKPFAACSNWNGVRKCVKMRRMYLAHSIGHVIAIKQTNNNNKNGNVEEETYIYITWLWPPSNFCHRSVCHRRSCSIAIKLPSSSLPSFGRESTEKKKEFIFARIAHMSPHTMLCLPHRHNYIECATMYDIGSDAASRSTSTRFLLFAVSVCERVCARNKLKTSRQLGIGIKCSCMLCVCVCSRCARMLATKTATLRLRHLHTQNYSCVWDTSIHFTALPSPPPPSPRTYSIVLISLALARRRTKDSWKMFRCQVTIIIIDGIFISVESLKFITKLEQG